MSTQITVNPWSAYGTNVTAGLNSIVGAIGTGPTISTVASAVASYITSTYGFSSSSLQIQNELLGICNNSINMYLGSNVLGGQAGYNPKQLNFIQMLAGNSLTSNVPITAIVNHVADIEDNIGTGLLSTTENMPLFLCTTILSNATTYWLAQVALGASSSWHAFFPASPENYTDIVYYAQAAAIGALAGFSAGNIDPSTSFYSNIAVAALAGALTVTTCKVVFGTTFMPRITNPISLNPQTIANLNMGGTGVAEIDAKTKLLCGSSLAGTICICQASLIGIGCNSVTCNAIA